VPLLRGSAKKTRCVEMVGASRRDDCWRFIQPYLCSIC
jgi:hypothetical protein